MSIPSTLISCFLGLASCGSMGSRIVNSLWLIEVDPHKGGSISLRPDAMRALSYRPFCSCYSRRVSLGYLSAERRYTTVDSDPSATRLVRASARPQLASTWSPVQSPAAPAAQAARHQPPGLAVPCGAGLLPAGLA